MDLVHVRCDSSLQLMTESIHLAATDCCRVCVIFGMPFHSLAISIIVLLVLLALVPFATADSVSDMLHACPDSLQLCETLRFVFGAVAARGELELTTFQYNENTHEVTGGVSIRGLTSDWFNVSFHGIAANYLSSNVLALDHDYDIVLSPLLTLRLQQLVLNAEPENSLTPSSISFHGLMSLEHDSVMSPVTLHIKSSNNNVYFEAHSTLPSLTFGNACGFVASPYQLDGAYVLIDSLKQSATAFGHFGAREISGSATLSLPFQSPFYRLEVNGTLSCDTPARVKAISSGLGQPFNFTASLVLNSKFWHRASATHDLRDLVNQAAKSIDRSDCDVGSQCSKIQALQDWFHQPDGSHTQIATLRGELGSSRGREHLPLYSVHYDLRLGREYGARHALVHLVGDGKTCLSGGCFRPQFPCVPDFFSRLIDQPIRKLLSKV